MSSSKGSDLRDERDRDGYFSVREGLLLAILVLVGFVPDLLGELLAFQLSGATITGLYAIELAALIAVATVMWRHDLTVGLADSMRKKYFRRGILILLTLGVTGEATNALIYSRGLGYSLPEVRWVILLDFFGV